jgi:hypothetical protein
MSFYIVNIADREVSHCLHDKQLYSLISVAGVPPLL